MNFRVFFLRRALRMARSLPPVGRILTRFARVLSENGIPAGSERALLFLQSVLLLGPNRLRDVYLAGLAVFGPGPDEREKFDQLFNAYFSGMQDGVVGEDQEVDEDDVRQSDFSEVVKPEAESDGMQASIAERLSDRSLSRCEVPAAVMQHLRQHRPLRRSFRRTSAHKGSAIDLRKALRQIVRNDGDILRPPRSLRRLRPRRLVILVDVSGSMKERTEFYLSFIHRALSAIPDVMAFTFATRLHDITAAMRRRRLDDALRTAAVAVEDWDGGTQIGPSLARFLSVPRYAGFARGASTLIISDGLERGNPHQLVQSVKRLSRLSWRLAWASPLAEDPRYQIRTAAMQAILPSIDVLGSASSEGLVQLIIDTAFRRATTLRPVITSRR